MARSILFWVLALIIAGAAMVYQRETGPTYPYRGEETIGAAAYRYELPRSHDIGDAPVELTIPDTLVQGRLLYKRYKTSDAETEIIMQRQGDKLIAGLPHQPPAGKLQYRIELNRAEQVISLPEKESIVIRFKGAVPAWILLPHILLMTLSVLVSTRAGLEALPATGKPRNYAFWAAGLFFVGGFIFGPMVQNFAFGELWTGVPFGWDYTDNKTLIAMLGWIVAVILLLRGKKARIAIVVATLLMLAMFIIPHSTGGSELNYETGKINTGQTK